MGIMKKKLIFGIALMLLLAGVGITYATSSASASVTITAGGVGGVKADVDNIAAVADTIKLKHSTGADAPYTHVAPDWSPVENEAGTVTAGDLYYVDCVGYTGDIQVTVYLTNPGALLKDYTYLNMQINVWEGDSPGPWAQATLADGSAIGTQFITPLNGYYTFLLSGNTHYVISIDDGSFLCKDIDADGGDLSPDFYIDIR
jgi:hypothetical protein